MLAIEIAVEQGAFIATERDGQNEHVSISSVPLSDDEEFEFAWLARINELREAT